MKKLDMPYCLKIFLGILLAQLVTLNTQADTSFTLEDISGQNQNIHFDDYAGNVILLDFWASWCGPCRQSFPWMNDIQAKYAGQGLSIIAINLDSDTEAANAFLEEVPANFVVGFDPEGASAETMHVEAMPMSYLIDREGHIRFRLMGFNSDKKSEHEALIQTLLKEPGR